METPKSLSPIGQLLEQKKLGSIVKKAQFLQKIQQLLMEAYPDLGSHCRVANINGKELVLEVDSAAWLMHIRFLNSAILNLVKKYLPEVTKIRQQICLPEIKKAPVYWEKKPLSAATRETIKQLANTISDKKLKQNLLKLAADCRSD